MRESGTLQDTIRANRVAAAKQAAIEVEKMAPADRAAFILQSSVQPVTDQDLYADLGRHNSARSALAASLSKGGKTKDDVDRVLDQLDLPTASDLARQVVGMIVTVPNEKVGKPESRDWVTERLTITEFVPNVGDPSELTRHQYEIALEVAKARQQAKQNAPQG